MNPRLKAAAKRVLPPGVLDAVRALADLPRLWERRATRRLFEDSPDAPSYLDSEALETLQKRYPPLPQRGYDARSLEARGLERAAQVLRLPGAREGHCFLELGCWDGMVSCALCRKGKQATAIDNREEGFDARAAREGVRLLKMDAAALQFADASFDFVFSYDAFEHFASPEGVLREAIRVLKQGGCLYLDFGPLYHSPFGEHAYRSITVPYCQFLFRKSMLADFAAKKGLKPIDFDQVNGWSLEGYRELWSRYAPQLKAVSYHEKLDLSHLDLIRAYPSCFKSKSACFESFLVAGIRALFRKG